MGREGTAPGGVTAEAQAPRCCGFWNVASRCRWMGPSRLGPWKPSGGQLCLSFAAGRALSALFFFKLKIIFVLLKPIGLYAISTELLVSIEVNEINRDLTVLN